MINRFRKITGGVYCGSAPSIKDVQELHKKFGIKKIISLDEESGDKISRACKLLGIKQIKIYLDGSRKTLLHLLKFNLKQLLMNDGPTYFHCHLGKDRTGLLSALFKCKYMGFSPQEAIEDSKSFGFGIGVDPKVVHLYETVIKACKQDDINAADIVSLEREYISDNRDSFLDEGHQGSFAPYLSQTRQDPIDSVYRSINDQSPTRENYFASKYIEESSNKDINVPLVGIYNNEAGIHGAGPTENVGGLIYD